MVANITPANARLTLMGRMIPPNERGFHDLENHFDIWAGPSRVLILIALGLGFIVLGVAFVSWVVAFAPWSFIKGAGINMAYLAAPFLVASFFFYMAYRAFVKNSNQS